MTVVGWRRVSCYKGVIRSGRNTPWIGYTQGYRANINHTDSMDFKTKHTKIEVYGIRGGS